MTTCGKSYDVPTADHGGTLPISRLIMVAHDDGTSTDLVALHVSTIEPLPPRRRGRRGA